MSQSSQSIKTILEISHHQNHADVNEYQHRKGVAEGFVDHVPEVEDLLRTGQEKDTLRKGCLFPGHDDRALQFAVARGEQSAERREVVAAWECSIPEMGNTERPQQGEQQHVNQSGGNGQLIGTLLPGETKGR